MRQFFRVIVIFGALVVLAVAGYLAWEVSQQGIPGEIAESGADVGTPETDEPPEVGITTESAEEIEQN